ncbi:hypothetical protein ACQEU3_08990 [Spirillospora sp. CA-253888]
MQLNGTATLTGQDMTADVPHPHGESALPCPRPVYFEMLRVLVARGVWAALPVLPTLLLTPAGQLCQTCAGTGYERSTQLGRPLLVCRDCTTDDAPDHPGFDLPRQDRPTGRAWLTDYASDGRPTQLYRLCDTCVIDPADLPWLPLDELPALRDALPWRPDCADCGDLGWVGDDRRPAYPVTLGL